MKASDFFSQIESQGIEVAFDYRTEVPPSRLSNEAMFHLPLIAIAILVLAKGQAKPAVDEIGQLVGDCYEQTFPDFRGSAQHLGWSAALRVRTVQALTFLVQAQLVSIEPDRNRIVCSRLGKAVVDRAISSGGDLASNLVAVERSYRNIRAERQLRLSPP